MGMVVAGKGDGLPLSFLTSFAFVPVTHLLALTLPYMK